MEPTTLYFDHSATTPVAEEVVEAMAEALRSGWGNPSSLHEVGTRAAGSVERARGQVARLLGARSPEEVVFTSGGTESIQTALHAALAVAPRGSVALFGATEHAAVREPLERRERAGLAVERVPVDREGQLDLPGLAQRLGKSEPPVALVSLHWANNETGALVPDAAWPGLVAACRAAGALLHVDAVQVPGKRPIDVQALGADLVSISAHKFHGPKGTGALYARRAAFEGRPFEPLLSGGPQERERRGGTPNVPGIVGMGAAAELARAHAADPAALASVRALRDRLEQGLLAAVPGAEVHGTGGPRLDTITSLYVPGVDGELLLGSLAAEGLAVSAGAACSASKRGPSPVLLAMGLDEAEALRTLRFSLSRLTRPEEVDAALALVPRIVAELGTLEAG